MKVLLAVLVAVAVGGANAASVKCEGAGEALCYVREMLRQTMSEVDSALQKETGDKEKRKSSFVRFGRSNVNEPDTEVEKRKSSFVRFGRSGGEADEINEQKRKSSFVRFGRSGNDESMNEEKRKSSFVRFGRSGSDVEGADKITEEKRKSSFVRFG